MTNYGSTDGALPSPRTRSSLILINPNPQDLLVPPYDSSERKSAIVVASFNLVATIVGGAVFSLPLAFEKCGVALATLLMIVAAFITDRSLQMLCICARQTGATSYGEVARAAFGEWMEWAVSLLLFIFLLFVLCAYMVLLLDIWTPLVVTVLDMPEESVRGEIVLLCILILLSPALVQHTLHALRFNCYVSFASVSFLCVALCYYGWIGAGSSPPSHNDISYAITPDVSDVLLAFPIIMLSFLSQFNIVPIQGALKYPSRQRMEFVVSSSIVICFLLMYAFGLGGYLYAGSLTKGNILLNVTNEWPFLLGRMGCGITIMMATTIMLLPCREAILEILDDCWVQQIHHVQHDDYDDNDDNNDNAENHHHEVDERAALLPGRQDHPIQDDPVFRNPIIHYGSTFLIIGTCYLGAVTASGVAIVWSLCGSSMAFLIGFIIPAACFIKIEHDHQQQAYTSSSNEANRMRRTWWLCFAWALLVFSIIGAIACTYSTVSRI